MDQKIRVKDVHGDNDIKSVIKSSFEKDRERYGYNFGVAIIKDAVCDNQEVLDSFKNKPY